MAANFRTDPITGLNVPTENSEDNWASISNDMNQSNGEGLMLVGSELAKRVISDPTDIKNSPLLLQETLSEGASGAGYEQILDTGASTIRSLKALAGIAITQNGNSLEIENTLPFGGDQFYNDTGFEIKAGSVLHLKSVIDFGETVYPTFELADAELFEKTQGSLVFAKEDVANATLGEYTTFSDELLSDTSGLTAGVQLWLACCPTPGTLNITDVKPDFPDYQISVGGSRNSDVNGSIWANQTTDVYNTFNRAFDGAIRESFNFTVSSNGTVVTGLLENVDNTRNLTLMFEELKNFDSTTTPATIALTAGTDENPLRNYVYIPESTCALTVSTSGWPSGITFAKIADLLVESAATVQANGGVRKNQNINNHLKEEGDNGHIVHMGDWMRERYANHRTGTEGSLTGTPTNGYVQVTGGVVRQIHEQTFPAQSMPTDDILIVNDFTTAYRSTTNLNTITTFSDGTSWTGWSNLVIWGVANKSGEPSHIFCNLPSDGYNSELRAYEDRDNHSDYNIPDEYEGTGFLIARFTVQISGGTITYNPATGYMDLRKKVPNNIAGGGGGGSVETIVPANTLIVDELATYGYSSIQTAITAASNNDVIIVYPSTYNEDLTITSKTVSIRGVDREKCIINGKIAYSNPGGTDTIEISNIQQTYTTTTDNDIAFSSESDAQVATTNFISTILYSGDIGVTDIKIGGNATLTAVQSSFRCVKTGGADSGIRDIKCLDAPNVTGDLSLANDVSFVHVTPTANDNLIGAQLGGTAPSHVANFLYKVDTSNVAYAGEMDAIKYTSNTTTKTGGDITVRVEDAGSGTLYVVRVDSTSGDFQISNVNGYYNGAGSAYAAYVNTGATLQNGGINLRGKTGLSQGAGTYITLGLFNDGAVCNAELDMKSKNIKNIKAITGDEFNVATDAGLYAISVNGQTGKVSLGHDAQTAGKHTIGEVDTSVISSTTGTIDFSGDDIDNTGDVSVGGTLDMTNGSIINAANIFGSGRATLGDVKVENATNGVIGYLGDASILAASGVAGDLVLRAEQDIVFSTTGSPQRAVLSSAKFDCNVDIVCAGYVATDDVLTLTTAQASAGVPNNSFFRDSGRSNKLSYKGVAGAITTIEP